MIKSFIDMLQGTSSVAEKNTQILFQTASSIATNNFKLLTDNLNQFHKIYEETAAQVPSVNNKK